MIYAQSVTQRGNRYALPVLTSDVVAAVGAAEIIQFFGSNCPKVGIEAWGSHFFRSFSEFAIRAGHSLAFQKQLGGAQPAGGRPKRESKVLLSQRERYNTKSVIIVASLRGEAASMS